MVIVGKGAMSSHCPLMTVVVAVGVEVATTGTVTVTVAVGGTVEVAGGAVVVRVGVTVAVPQGRPNIKIVPLLTLAVLQENWQNWLPVSRCAPIVALDPSAPAP